MPSMRRNKPRSRALTALGWVAVAIVAAAGVIVAIGVRHERATDDVKEPETAPQSQGSATQAH